MNKKVIAGQGQKYENEKEHTRKIQKAVTGKPIDTRLKDILMRGPLNQKYTQHERGFSIEEGNRER